MSYLYLDVEKFDSFKEIFSKVLKRYSRKESFVGSLTLYIIILEKKIMSRQKIEWF